MNDRSRTTRRRVVAAAAGSTLALSLLAACGSGDDDVPVVNLYGFAAAAGFPEVIADCNERADGEYRIVGNLLPSDADGQREQFVRRLAAKDTGMDLLGLDVTWTAEFAEAGWIRELTPEQAEAATEDVLDKPIETATWKDKLYAIPKHTNVQLLWYRKSLVPEPPKTWDEMLDMAQELKDEGEPYQIGFTGARYEGLVVGFNTILSSFGGTLVNDDSTEATVDDKTVAALELMERFATSGLASRSLSNSQEPEVFADLQQGRAAFILNWPYVLSAMRTAGESDAASKEVADDLGFAPYPSVVEGEPPRVTLGGMNFAISQFSEHPEETFDAAMCLRDEKAQLQVANVSGEPPVLRSIYDDPEFQKNYPQYEEMLVELETASTRPVSPLYQNISTIVSSVLSPPRSIRPEQTAETMRTDIQQAIEGKGILP